MTDFDWRIPARDLNDDELAAHKADMHRRIDDFFSDDEFEGHGGSPGEWMFERLNEIETEEKRRGG